MPAPTWSEIKTELQAEYDLSEETFVNATELLYYANAAIQHVEKEIHTFNDKYFEAEANIALTTGVDTYSLPSDIYGNKITGVFYSDSGALSTGGIRYEIKPVRKLEDLMSVSAAAPYCYRITNIQSVGTRFKLYPASRETSSSNVTMFYRREAKQFTSDSDTLDIPEAKQFIKQYVVEKAKNKETMTPDAPLSPRLEGMLKSLLESLENMIDDNNNDIVVTFDHYEESV